MKLKLYEEEYKVLKLQDPLNTTIDGIYFYSQTNDEYSLVCKENIDTDPVISIEKQYRLFMIEGVLDFSLVGIISKISSLLAQNSISIFVISTYNTDYFMVKSDKIEQTIALLECNDYCVN